MAGDFGGLPRMPSGTSSCGRDAPLVKFEDDPVNEATIFLLERSFINFEDRTYRWIDTKHFSFGPGGSPDSAVLSALIAHPQYRDTYLSPDSHSIDSQTIHGPYLVERISAASFHRLDLQQAQATLDEFSSPGGYLPPPAIRERIAREISQPFESASSIYRLGEVPDASHELTGILLEFRELITISAAMSRLSLHVAAID